VIVAIREEKKLFVLAFGEVDGQGVQLGYSSKEALIEAMHAVALLIEASSSVEEAVVDLKMLAIKHGFTIAPIVPFT
jgi:hypothetical protein